MTESPWPLSAASRDGTRPNPSLCLSRRPFATQAERLSSNHNKSSQLMASLAPDLRSHSSPGVRDSRGDQPRLAAKAYDTRPTRRRHGDHVYQAAMANPTWTTAVVIDEAATEAPYGTMTGARGLQYWLSLH
ncbi:hypothetical protein N7452_001588 [Penicillium brevicompactum]|uniref:Uncharacterized protein n=1 Tax=Penicillium brevicompactum TaxID=5074 RepID=A0A9W9UQ88_PENBR|nr:hypothetical protein N7452_001588 [Penicillium brevicompactum]